MGASASPKWGRGGVADLPQLRDRMIGLLSCHILNEDGGQANRQPCEF